MTTITSVVPAVIDYLVEVCQASPLLGQAQPDPVVVLDGPETTADTMAEARHLWIGGVPERDGEPATASSAQDFALLDHARTRDETGEIQCAAHAWSGSTVMKAQRDACAGIVAAVELELRGDEVSGGPGDASLGGIALWAQVTETQWTPRQSPSGAEMTCMFKIAYRARLTTG